jgi:hypothetical protein
MKYILIVLFIALPLRAATFYIDPDDGDDAANGGTLTPWKTLTRARPYKSGEDPQVQSGDTVLLRGGTYPGFNWNGIGGHGQTEYITYTPEDAVGDPPIIVSFEWFGGNPDACDVFIKLMGLNFPWSEDRLDNRAIQVSSSNYVWIDDCNFTGNGDERPDDACIWIHGSAGFELSFIKVTDCNFFDITTAFSFVRIGVDGGSADSGAVVTGCRANHFYNDAFVCTHISYCRFEDNQIYDGQILGNLELPDACDTMAGTWTVGTSITQTATGLTGTFKYYDPTRKVFHIRGDKGVSHVSGWDLTEIVAGSGGTFTTSGVTDAVHSDVFQIDGSEAEQCVDNIIRSNILYDCYQGIFMKHATNLLIENNLVKGWIQAHPIYVHNRSVSATIRNNTVVNYPRGVFPNSNTSIGINSNTGTGLTFDIHNNLCAGAIIFGPDWGTTLNEANNIVATFGGEGQVPDDTTEVWGTLPMTQPELELLFTDPNNGGDPASDDYTLLSDANAVDFGDPENAPSTDILGVNRDESPDAGAYEFVAAGLPSKATNPDPAHTGTGISITNDLSWVNGGGALNYDVRFGTSSPGAVQGNQDGSTFDTSTMLYDQLYYWRIDANNASGLTTGDVWSFTTEAAPTTKYFIGGSQ